MARFYNLKKQQQEEKQAAYKASRGVLNDSNSEPSFF